MENEIGRAYDARGKYQKFMRRFTVGRLREMENPCTPAGII
jgi:hypothetical protein